MVVENNILKTIMGHTGWWLLAVNADYSGCFPAMPVDANLPCETRAQIGVQIVMTNGSICF